MVNRRKKVLTFVSEDARLDGAKDKKVGEIIKPEIQEILERNSNSSWVTIRRKISKNSSTL